MGSPGGTTDLAVGWGHVLASTHGSEPCYGWFYGASIGAVQLALLSVCCYAAIAGPLIGGPADASGTLNRRRARWCLRPRWISREVLPERLASLRSGVFLDGARAEQ
jgi:hypothetical protein